MTDDRGEKLAERIAKAITQGRIGQYVVDEEFSALEILDPVTYQMEREEMRRRNRDAH